MSSSLLVDRVKILILSSGVGPFSLGQAVTGFRGVEALVDGATYSYAVENGGQYEEGQGTYVALGPQFLRFPEISSNGGAAVAFPANMQLVFTARAADLVATGGTFPIVNALGNNPEVAIGQQAATAAINGKVDQVALANSGGADTVGSLNGGSVQDALDGKAGFNTSRADIKAAPIGLASSRFLSEGGRSGWFTLMAGSAPSDPQEGLYLISSTPGYYWARLWDGVTAAIEWFGAVPNDGSSGAAAANVAAFAACVALCPVTQFLSADYWTNDTLKVQVGYRTVRGAVLSTGYGTSGTRILCKNGAKSVFQFGPDTMPGGGVNAFPRGISAQDICARWDAAMVIPSPGSEATAAKAFDYRYMIGGQFSNLAAHEPFIGHYMYGVVSSRFDDCSAFRSVNFGANDFFRGFWLQGTPAILAGGNGSVYVNRPTVTAAGGAVTANIGYYCNANFADSYFIWPECAGMTQAMIFDGGGAGASNGMLDVHVENPIFDQCGSIGVDIVQLNELATITIRGGYIQMKAGADKAVWARGGGGSVTLTGGLQIICSDGGITSATFGVRGSNQPHLTVDSSVTIKESGTPISLDGGCYGGTIRPKIFMSARPGGSRFEAAYVADCDGMDIAPAVKAHAGAVSFEQGVRFGGTSTRCVVDASEINAAAVTTPLKSGSNTMSAPGFYKSDGSSGTQADKGIEVRGFVG